ncbi:MAG: DJ-1/PfpI family protein [Lachnospiraceae bacterium]|nr:DJ-1/PfpI family protein [Lachnospiraceae bacterium]
MKKIGVFLADGFEEIEGLTVVDLLRRAGIEVAMISIMGRKEIYGSHQIGVLADVLYEEVDFGELEGVVLPGGMPGTTHLGSHSGVNEVIRSFAEEGKLVSAICAAPSVLGQAGILQGRRAACYPGCEDKLTGAEVVYEEVAEAGNVITSRGMGTAIPFGLKLVEYLITKQKAEELAEAIVYSLTGKTLSH